MNLQVNLLHENEVRGADGLRPAALMRIGGLAAGGVVLLSLLWIVQANWRLRQELAGSRTEWQQLEKRYHALQAAQLAATTAESVLGEMVAFSNAQLRVSGRLAALGGMVPPSIQLTELRLATSVVDAEKNPARLYTLHAAGRCRDADAAAIVAGFLEDLKDLPPPIDLGTVTPGSFGPDPAPSAGPNDQLFEARCLFSPRPFK